jgi:hypothetical protein
MARINVEDDIQRKPGFQKLMIKLGDRHKALGVAVDLWQLAQKYWYPEKKLIPLHVFQEADLPECLCDPGIGLAEKRADGIYARGSEDQFAWLFDAVNAGKKSAEIRKQKYGSAQPGNNKRKKNPRTTFEQPSNGVGTPPKVTEPPNSLLSSHSSFLNTQNSNLISNSSDGEKNLPSDAPKTLGSVSFERYSNAYRDKYKEPPVRNKKINSLFKQLGERLGEEAPEVSQFYLSHSDFFYIRAKHSVELLVRDAEKLRTEWKTGDKTTSISSRKSELDDHNTQVIDDYIKSKQVSEREVNA